VQIKVNLVPLSSETDPLKREIGKTLP